MKAPNSNKNWLESLDKKLLEMNIERKTVTEMSSELGRSEYGIQNRLSALRKKMGIVDVPFIKQNKVRSTKALFSPEDNQEKVVDNSYTNDILNVILKEKGKLGIEKYTTPRNGGLILYTISGEYSLEIKKILPPFKNCRFCGGTPKVCGILKRVTCSCGISCEGSTTAIAIEKWNKNLGEQND
jgi:hypothetical protein